MEVLARVRADLARFVAGMGAEAKAALTALFEAALKADAAKPRAALRTALQAFVLTHEATLVEADGKTAPVWAKRDAAVMPEAFAGIKPWNYNVLVGDLDGDGDVDYACKSCLKSQTPCACAACAHVGPGSYCFACGRELAYSCPKCQAPWSPIPLVELQTAGRMVTAVVKEKRVSADKVWGIVRSIVTGAVEDSYGTTINPGAIAKRIKPGRCLIDIDHGICDERCQVKGVGCRVHGGPIDGAACSSVVEAKVPVPNQPGQTVDTAIVETTFDLRMPRSKMLYDGICDGTWTELSILFTYSPEVDEAVRSGAKKRLEDEDLIDVPAYTFTANASCPVAKVTEIRTRRVLAQRTAGDATAPAAVPISAAPVLDAQTIIPNPVTPITTPAAEAAPDLLADLRDAVSQAVGSTGNETAVSPATAPVAPPAPAAPETAPAGGAPELSLVSIANEVKDLRAVIEVLRTASPSKEWQASLTALDSAIEAKRTTLQGIVDELGRTVEGQRILIKELIKLQVESTRSFDAKLKSLTAPPPRAGHGGADNSALSEAMRTAQNTVPQYKPDAHLAALQDSSERLARLGVSPLSR